MRALVNGCHVDSRALVAQDHRDFGRVPLANAQGLIPKGTNQEKQGRGGHEPVHSSATTAMGRTRLTAKQPLLKPRRRAAWRP